MFQAGKLLSRTIALWEGLAAAVKAHLDEIPHAASDLEAFEASISLVRELATEQDQLIARLRELTRLRAEAVETGRRRRNRLVGHVQGHYGPESERLIEYNLNPRRSRRRSTFAGEVKLSPPAAAGE